MPIEELISILADGSIHSGEALGVSLGISRVAVWKRLKKLDDIGVEVETIKGKGYRLVDSLELLSADRINELSRENTRTFISEIEIFFQINSTNTWLIERVRSAGINGVVCLAEQQTAGRGRRGRQWHSPFGRNIYMSVGWEFSQGAAALEGLSLAVGVAMARALSSAGVSGLALKWPNDLLCHGKKLAGVLLEMSGDASGSCSVVVGIGLNVDMKSEQGDNIDQPWVDVASAVGSGVSRNLLLATILDELLPLLASYQDQGFSRYQQEWNSLDALSGQLVELHGPVTSSLDGIAQGVDDTGALRIKTSAGIRLIKGGEVSLRKRSVF